MLSSMFSYSFVVFRSVFVVQHFIWNVFSLQVSLTPELQDSDKNYCYYINSFWFLINNIFPSIVVTLVVFIITTSQSWNLMLHNCSWSLSLLSLLSPLPPSLRSFLWSAGRGRWPPTSNLLLQVSSSYWGSVFSPLSLPKCCSSWELFGFSRLFLRSWPSM